MEYISAKNHETPLLSYFRINDPYRLIGVFLLLFIFRISVFFSGNSQIIPELEWMLVGERLADGGMMYVDVFHPIAPLAAWTYNLLDWIIGRSHIGYMIFAFLLVCLQSTLFNRLLLKNNAFPQNTYVPALVYGVLLSLFFDFYTLSPVLLSMTFILLALEKILSHIENRSDRDEPILSIGLHLGMAMLFYLPSVVFFISTILVLVIFTGTVIRRYLLICYGFIVPPALVGLYYFFFSEFDQFYYSLILPFFQWQGGSLLDVQSFLLILILPNFFLILSMLRMLQRLRFSNYQISLLRVMFLIFAFTFLAFVITNNRKPHTLIIFAPTVAFFLSHWFLLMKRGLRSEIAFLFFVGGIVVINLGSFHDMFGVRSYINPTPMLVQPTEWDEATRGKSLVFLGDEISAYKSSKLATPYLNWDLSSKLFLNPNYYDNISHIYQQFSMDPPEVIIDDKGVLGPVFEKMPKVSGKYRQSGNIYFLRP